MLSLHPAMQPIIAPILALSCLGTQAFAQTLPAPAEEIIVISNSPLLGSGQDRALMPAATQTLTSTDIARTGPPDLLAALNAQIAAINLDSASGNPNQPSLFYNGFEVSPLQGTAQGLAIYLNGVRFNTAFGDTVNWDLIPNIAINHVNIEGANPLFGLNALGGSINIALKDGFTSPGGELNLAGGAFTQARTDLQYGAQFNNQAIYIAAAANHESGWRNLQSSDIQNLYANWAIQKNASSAHLDLALANSNLNGPGTSPVQLLAADPAAQFTAPNAIANRYLQLAPRANIALTETLSLQTQAYYSYFQQRVANGNAPNDAPCNNGSGLLCQSPGIPSTTRGGATIPDFLNGGPYSELDTQTTNTNAYGAALQITHTGNIGPFENHLVAGASFDGGQTEFSATAYIGGLTPLSRIFIGPGIALDEPGITTPVRVAITNAYSGAFATDTVKITQKLALTFSARLNQANLNLNDQSGGDLTGQHAYRSANPAAGATYQALHALTLYASYAQSSRAPTPAELSCAGPQNSCSLANFFVGDPNLKQVIAHTIEAGLRGQIALPSPTRKLNYSLSLFHTDLEHDIAFINSPTLNRAYFANIGATRRQGLSAHLDATSQIWSSYIDVTLTDPTIQSRYVESAGNNPAASPNGTMTIQPGSTLPGIPRLTIKLGADLALSKSWQCGIESQYQTGQYLVGDEANLTPRLPGYVVINAHTLYNITSKLQIYGNIQNLLNRHYSTFATFAPVTAVFLAQAPGATNPRSYSPAAPLGGLLGLRLKF